MAIEQAAETIADITLDASLKKPRLHLVHSRDKAISEILEDNFFSWNERPAGPYRLGLSVDASRLVLSIDCIGGEGAQETISVPFHPFRRIVKDYHIVCESYQQAIDSAFDASKIEAIDMGRRGLHNEGADILLEYLSPKVTVDYETCRRMFTILSILLLR